MRVRVGLRAKDSEASPRPAAVAARMQQESAKRCANRKELLGALG